MPMNISLQKIAVRQLSLMLSNGKEAKDTS